MNTERLSYEAMGEITDPIQMKYLDAAAALPKGGEPVMWEGYPTTKPLLDLWKEHRAELLAAFEAGGWTEEEFTEENVRRVDAYRNK